MRPCDHDGFEEGYRPYDPEAEAADRRRQQRKDDVCAATYESRLQAVAAAISHLEQARNGLTATGRLDLANVDHQIDQAVVSLAPVVMPSRRPCRKPTPFDGSGGEWVKL